MTVLKNSVKKRSIKTESSAPPAEVGLQSYAVARLLEPSTWAGILSIGAVFATGSVASWLNPSTLPVLISGIGLILAKEQKEGV